jgi:hypothetical protein
MRRRRASGYEELARRTQVTDDARAFAAARVYLGPGRFGILLPETGEVEAVNNVERVGAVCELWLESGAIALRLAIGWASPAADTSLSDAFNEAQERMFAELRRSARRGSDGETDGQPPAAGLEGAPSPA